MSAELTKARSLLSGMNFHLKQQKLLPAVHNLYEAILIILKNPLMKSERDEFTRLLDQAFYLLNNDQGLRKIYPLSLDYEPGKEKELLTVLRELINELSAQTAEDAKDLMAEMERRRGEMLAKAQMLLEAGEIDAAKRLFDRVIKENQQDADLKADIAERFLKAEQYMLAFEYLDEALKDDPKAIHLYNRIGIVLRKMQDYQTAEKYYKRALEIAPNDEYLHFNVGRLYIDWKVWPRVEESAQKCLEINPDFAEARKMLQFALKKQGKA